MHYLELRYLTSTDKAQFLKATQADWGEFNFDFYWETIAKKNFEYYVKILPEFSNGLHLPKDHVCCTILFAFNESNELVGRVSIRHQLNEFLLREGGHIGYGVVPWQRRKGYATLILEQSLRYIQKHLPELKNILVTCDEDNIGSRKTIEKHQGTLENIVKLDNGKNKRRYWIKL